MTAILPPLRKLESIQLRTPLGIRFRDIATYSVVRDGLQVSAYPFDATFPEPQRRTAFVNPSGIWVINDLVRLREYELGGDEFQDAGSPPGRLRYRVEVQDEEGRFLPFFFTAEAPTQGVLQLPIAGSSPWPWLDVPLFSAPERIPPSGCAVIRASLAAFIETQPASWALIQARASVRSRTIAILGMSNAQGQIALMFPWPELTGLAVSSPPGGMRVDGLGWEFQFLAWHDFETEARVLADLDAVLGRLVRSPDQLWSALSPPTAFTTATLNFGQELILPELESPLAPNRTLLITPMGSPV